MAQVGLGAQPTALGDTVQRFVRALQELACPLYALGQQPAQRGRSGRRVEAADQRPRGDVLPGREGMLAIARARAAELDRPVNLLQGDAQALPFEDAAFDTVVCTFSLCSIPEIDVAVGQMHRVLRPGGRLVLADHIESSSMPVRGLQRLMELITVPQAEEHFRRRPLNQVRAAGFSIEQIQRFKLGIVERLTARKPATP